jgi:RNA polymerase sigma factor (TIGR02999 family)
MSSTFADDTESAPRPATVSPDQERLLALYYDEVRQLARRILGAQGGALALQPTELANEAAIRIMRGATVPVDRTHLLALSARVLRQVLIDEVRWAKSAKRTPQAVQTVWVGPDGRAMTLDIEEVDLALAALAQVSAEHARIVELRFFVGLSLEETAQSMGMSLATAKRRWQAARAWLLDALKAT